MTIPTCSSFGRCRLSRIPVETHSFWDCRTVPFQWLSGLKRPPFLHARNLTKRTKVLGSHSSSRVSPTANEPRRDRNPRRKRAGKPRPEPWETCRKRNHGRVKEIFFELRGGNGPPPRNSSQRPVASSRTAVKEQSRFDFCPDISDLCQNSTKLDAQIIPL